MCLDSSFLGDEFNHARPSPRLGEVHSVYHTLGIGNSHDCCTDGITRCLHDEFFTNRHHLAVVTKGLIELHHRELGIVTGTNSLIAEHTTDFIDAFHATHNEALEVKFKGDAQVQLHIKRVVMSEERPCMRSTSLNMQNGCLNFDELFCGQSATET
ncbi:unannotated protein [freshwater metagenome]|uniref:Unannotated protein n=1 Tax=freshwater metagenome TaxID=449393 RepID=A0A6J7VZ36_9ZZZZ